jgi:hypothetical protein
MQQSSGRRALALAVALTLASAGSALAQDTTETGRARIDTTEPAVGAIDTAGVDTAGADTAGADTSAVRDTTDTSAVQNPPGYRGMERDTTMFPAEAGDSATPGQAEDRATGTYDDSTWQDTTGAEQNPAGYRGMERVSGDSAGAHDTTGTGHTGTHDSTP